MDFIGLGKKRKYKEFDLPKENYQDKARKKENEYLVNLDRAEDERVKNGHTKLECQYLQVAKEKCEELAKLSEGAERKHRLMQVEDLQRQLEVAIRAIDPDLVARVEKEREERAKAKEEKSDVTQKNTKTASNPKNSREINEDEIQAWFKEAPKHSLADVSGMEELKKTLKKCADDSHNKLREYMKKELLNSYLFIGPPGCGKTYLVEAFAHELLEKDYKYMALNADDILDPLVGRAEKKVARLFEEVQKNAPCIVFIDEIDGVCKSRNLPNLPEYSKSLTTAFLTGYNEIVDSDKKIIFICATNYPNQIDNAMLDRVRLIRVPMPSKDERATAFKREIGEFILLEEDFSYEETGEKTKDYNYRDIKRVVAQLKDSIEEEIDKEGITDEEAIEELKSGKRRLTKNLFSSTLASSLPTPKDAILKELDEWEKRFNEK